MASGRLATADGELSTALFNMYVVTTTGCVCINVSLSVAV